MADVNGRMRSMTRVLVTGGCGFIGANLVRFLVDRTSWSVRVVDDLRSGNRGYVGEDLAEVVIGDVADPSVLAVAMEEIDAVIHLASQTGVMPSMKDPVRDFEGNAVTTFRALEACRRQSVGTFVFASTGAALGDVTGALHEELVPAPVSPYGAGKLAGEAYCRGYAGAFGMNTVALRFSNVYGPFSVHKNNAVPNFIKRCLRAEPLDVYGDGSQTRDFIHVDDLCEAIAAATTVTGVAGEVIQLGTGTETSVLDLAATAQEATGTQTEIRFHERRAGEVYRSRTDISKARKLLGFDPTITLAEGMRHTAEWYRDNWLPSAG